MRMVPKGVFESVGHSDGILQDGVRTSLYATCASLAQIWFIDKWEGLLMLARFASSSYTKPIASIALVMFFVLGFASAFLR